MRFFRLERLRRITGNRHGAGLVQGAMLGYVALRRTRRISWDGIWNLRVEQDRLKGQAWNPFDDSESPFSVDLKTGDVEGGSYTEAM